MKSLLDRAQAQRLERAAAWFFQDYRWANKAVAISGMNWAAFELGGRVVDRSVSAETMDDPLYRVAAQRRLKALAGRFSPAAYRELQALTVERHSARRFGSDFNYRPYHTTIRAIDLMRRLSWTYETELEPPDGVDLMNMV